VEGVTDGLNEDAKPIFSSMDLPKEMVTNVDGERVPKGSEKDDRWGPYGTQRKKPVNVNSNPPGEMFTAE